jgi:hypothetical protein
LGGCDVGCAHFCSLDVEQVEGADDRAPQPHGQGVDGAEAGGEGLSSEKGLVGVARSACMTGLPLR